MDEITLRILGKKEIAEVLAGTWGMVAGNSLEEKGTKLLGIYVSDTCAGYIEVRKENKDKEYSIGYRIFPSFQGNHYAMKAVYAFCNDYPYAKLYAQVQITNEKSVHILTHNGFEIVKKEEDVLYLEKTKQQCVSETFESVPHKQWIIFAGGCFWGVEHVFQTLYGVKETICGYANGEGIYVNYASVCTGEGNYKEAVAVAYDECLISLTVLLDVFFHCIDSSQYQRQMEDIGRQYQTGVYYLQDGEKIHIYMDSVRGNYDAFYVECEPLRVFYTAEQYHQSYLQKHPDGYCHIPLRVMRYVQDLNRSLQELNSTSVE